MGVAEWLKATVCKTVQSRIQIPLPTPIGNTMTVPRNIEQYVKVYQNILDNDFCKETIQQLSNIQWQQHRFYRSRSSSYVSFVKELSVSFDRTSNASKIELKLRELIADYVSIDFADFRDWYSMYNAFANIRWNRYDIGTKMKLHCDHIHTLFQGPNRGVPVLSIVGALNEDYEGGEFMMWQDTEITLPQGSVLIFPSNFMYPHEVKEVASGTRYTYVTWAW